MERLISYLVVWSVVSTVFAGVQNPQAIVKNFKTKDGYGVASVAGVSSRNGRVSSVSGVNFFPSGSNPFYFPMGRSADKIPEPISFMKEENGKITSGTINYGPGSVSVTSVARSVFPEDSTKVIKGMGKMPMLQSMFKSSQIKPNDMFFMDPFATFNSRSLNPWFPDTFMFKQPTFRSVNSMIPGWPYSDFSPYFNFWRR